MKSTQEDFCKCYVSRKIVNSSKIWTQDNNKFSYTSRYSLCQIKICDQNLPTTPYVLIFFFARILYFLQKLKTTTVGIYPYAWQHWQNFPIYCPHWVKVLQHFNMIYSITDSVYWNHQLMTLGTSKSIILFRIACFAVCNYTY